MPKIHQAVLILSALLGSWLGMQAVHELGHVLGACLTGGRVSQVWALWLFGAVTFRLGLWLWHRQGPHFGLGDAGGQVNPRVAYAALAGLVV
jgi:hypothetical protein